MAEAFKGDICPACPGNSSSGSCGGNNSCGLPCKSQTLAAYLDNTGYVVNVFDLESYLESHGVHKCSHMSTVIGPTTGICKAYKMYLEKSIGSKKLRKAKRRRMSADTAAVQSDAEREVQLARLQRAG